MTDFSTDFIRAQREIAAAATEERPGPYDWSVVDASEMLLYSKSDPYEDMNYILSCRRCERCIKENWDCGWPSDKFSEFIKSACNHYPDALTEIERQTARAEHTERERDALREAVRAMWPVYTAGICHAERGGYASLNALRANAEAAQHIDRAVLDTILEVVGGEG